MGSSLVAKVRGAVAGAASRHGKKIVAVGGAAALAVGSSAQAAITSTTLTDIEGTFAKVLSMGEAASVVAATLALISVGVAFIWRAKG